MVLFVALAGKIVAVTVVVSPTISVALVLLKVTDFTSIGLSSIIFTVIVFIELSYS